MCARERAAANANGDAGRLPEAQSSGWTGSRRPTGAAKSGQRAARRPSWTADRKRASAMASTFVRGACHVVCLKASLSSTGLMTGKGSEQYRIARSRSRNFDAATLKVLRRRNDGPVGQSQIARRDGRDTAQVAASRPNECGPTGALALPVGRQSPVSGARAAGAALRRPSRRHRSRSVRSLRA